MTTDTLPKVHTGIKGLDEVLFGGFPESRPVLVCGGPGCGKTLMAIQFLVKGATDFNEPGVLMTFEESAGDLSQNVKSLGFDLDQLVKENKLRVDHVRIDSSEIEETGEYDLEGLFVRLNYAIDSIGAKRVVLDTIESLFGGLTNTGILRSELRRLFSWLKNKGVTTLITGEKGNGTRTRQGLEEYISDCVILLDFRVIDQIATRRMRVVKYRGSLHGTNEYPFLIDENGLSVLPITSLKLEYDASTKIISTGIPELDKMFSKNGIYKNSGVLLTGTAGTAKSIFASYFAISSCRKGERVLYFSFEESPNQIIRNMKSIGLDMQHYVNEGILHIHASRPSLFGLEMHLLTILKLIEDINPGVVILDPISSLITIGSESEVRAMLIRLLDSFKSRNISSVFTSLLDNRTNDFYLSSHSEISSLADTWIILKNELDDEEMTRSMLIIKSRGMGHVNKLQKFIITDSGVKFV